MKFTDKATDSTLDFEDLFLTLIRSNGIRYSDFHTNLENYKDKLDSKTGVYHFFSKSNSKCEVASLYVGKAGSGSGNWNLYERLKQHQQPSQENTIHGKIAEKFGISNEKAITFLSDSSVYIQYVELNDNIIGLEQYCICRLKPEYTDK